MGRRAKRLLAVVGGVIFTAATLASALARTIRVDDDGPADFRTIQEAVDAAAAGDEVLVAPGLYLERSTRTVPLFYDIKSGLRRSRDMALTANVFMKDGVSLIGSGADHTIVDAGGVGSAVVFTGIKATARLSGLTLRGGTGNLGVYVSGNTFNFPAGGGIFVFNAAPVITENLITGNRAGSEGGGIFVAYSYYTPPRIERNVIRNNVATRGGGGVALVGGGVVAHNLIVGNSAPMGSGGGIGFVGPLDFNAYVHYWLNEDAYIINNTIVGNEAEYYAGIVADEGGGGNGPIPFVSNNIIVGNVAFGGIGGISELYYASYSNDVWDNRPTNYIVVGGVEQDRTGVDGHISADPLFLDEASGDFRVGNGSPVIDVGYPYCPRRYCAGKLDFEGNARPLDGNADAVAIVDIGAFEFNRGDLVGLRFGEDTATLTWRPESSALQYNVYRGDFEVLLVGSFGTCIGSLDPAVAGSRFVDSTLPSLQNGFFYVVSQRTAAGEQSIGFDSRGLERFNSLPCP